MPYPPITALPPTPSRNAPSTFSALMDAFLAAFPQFRAELIALAAYLDTLALATGPGLFQNGSVAAPGISWALDTNTGLFRPAADQIGFATGGVQRALLSGTALQLDVPLTGTAVVQSMTDTTAGRVVTAGWMGLGATAVPDVDANATGLATRVARFTPANGPDGVDYFHGLHLSRVLDGQSAQIAVRDTGAPNPSLMAIRHRDSAGSWSAWNVLYGRRNAIGAVSQSAGQPTGALFEIGSGGNGRYERRASGFSAAARLDLTVTNVNTAYGALYRSADIVWTFPSAHVTGELPVIAVNAAHSDVIGFRVISISETAVTFQLVAAASITGAVTVRATAAGRWSTMS